MVIRGVVDRIEEEQVIVLVGDEALVWPVPRALLPNVSESDMICFRLEVELPAEEVRKMGPKELLDRLSLHN